MALNVYLDGAGKEADHPVITFGGFFAAPNICAEIEDQWLGATQGKVFHLTDFGTPKCKLGSAQWTTSERGHFLKKLALIVNRPDCCIASASIQVKTFNEVLYGAAHPQELGPASSACAYVAILNVEGVLLNEHRQKQQVDYVLEKGDREHEINKVFADWDSQNSAYKNLRTHAFLSKKTALLQPADFVAGVVQRCVVSAFRAHPLIGLDNGLARTRVKTFDSHYSHDGVTAALLSGHDTTRCWVMNAQAFRFLDTVGKDFFLKHPDKLKKSMKSAPYKPKVNK